MMKKFRPAIIILLVVLAAVCFISCNKNGNPDDTVTDGGNARFTVAENGASLVKVIRSDNASDSFKNAVKEISSELSKLIGADNVEMGTDLALGGELSHDTYEILVGPTDYSESREVMESVGYGEYTITVKGKKLIVAAWSDKAVKLAVDALIKLFNENIDANKTIVIPANTLINVVADEKLHGIPVFTGGTYSYSYDCGDSCDMMAYKSTADEYRTYCGNLTAAGYTEYSTNEINGNLYGTYTNSTYSINTVYTNNDKVTRIIYEPLNKISLVGLESDNKYTKVCDPLLTMIGISPDGDDTQNGMCFIFRLEDGRFVIYDGGLLDRNGFNNAGRIYSTLKSQAKDPKNIVIAAWLITHSHSDHVGAFQAFATNYSNKNYPSNITIERFIANFPSEAAYTKAETGYYWYTNTMAAVNAKFTSDGQPCFPGIQIIKAHPGMKIYLANMRIDVLYTHELQAPLLIDNLNNASVITRVNFCGQTLLMLGDMHTIANPIVQKVYGKTLESDFVQVAHHGYRGGTTAFYTCVDPTYVLWPMGNTAYSVGGYKDNKNSEYFFKSDKCKNHIYVAGWSTYVFSMPFNGTNYTVTPNT